MNLLSWFRRKERSGCDMRSAARQIMQLEREVAEKKMLREKAEKELESLFANLTRLEGPPNADD